MLDIAELLAGDLLAAPRRVGKPPLRELAGIWSARRGPYRVIYEIDDETLDQVDLGTWVTVRSPIAPAQQDAVSSPPVVAPGAPGGQPISGVAALAAACTAGMTLAVRRRRVQPADGGSGRYGSQMTSRLTSAQGSSEPAGVLHPGLEDAEAEAALAEHRAWVAAGRPGAVSHEEAMAELLRGR